MFLLILLTKDVKMDISNPDSMTTSAVNPGGGCGLMGDCRGIRLYRRKRYGSNVVENKRIGKSKNVVFVAYFRLM
jgi:hypothetical protein